MDPLTQLAQLGPHLGGVVAGIRPDQLDAPTPCDDFTVRGVLEHMITGATAFAAAYRGTTPADPDRGDPLGSFGAVLGDLPGDTFARFVVLDGLVASADAFVRQTLDPLRDGVSFAAAVEPAPDASPIDRLAHYTGRR